MKIEKLTLFANNIATLKNFYSEQIGLEILEDFAELFSVKIGDSVLKFIESENYHQYHFAINVPSNQIKSSLEWIKAKIQTQKYNGDEIIKFVDWNAESIYFYDSNNNIVELIARKNLSYISYEKFDHRSFLSISEIGIPTSSTKKFYDYLNINYELKKYDCDTSRFCAVGDEEGLFIVIDYNNKKWIPNMDEARPYKFEVIFIDAKNDRINLRFQNDEIIEL